MSVFALYLRVPFNWRTPFGYLLYAVFFIAGGLTISMSATATISFCIGSFMLVISFVEDATNDLTSLNVEENSKSYDIDVKIRFHSAVRAYSDLKELSVIFSLIEFKSLKNDFFFHRFIDEFNIIFKYKILLVFFWNQLTIFTSIVIFLALLVKY